MSTPNLQSDPDFIPAATQPQPQGDPDFIPAATQPQPQPTPPARPSFDAVANARQDWERIKGFAKGVARTGAGALDLANTMVPRATGSPEAIPELRTFTDKVRARTQMTNPAQESGDFVESALEFLPLMEEEAPGAVKSLADKFAMGQDLAKFAQKYPKIAAAFNVAIAGAKGAARGGAEQGAQTYVKTGGDVEATREAAKTGAEFSGVAGAATEAAGQTVKAIAAGRPTSRTVAGANFETDPKTGKLILRNLADVTQDPATQAVDEATGNIAKTGVANSLNRATAERAPEAQIAPPSRQLPGRAGYDIATGEPTPTGEGQIAFDPGKQQIGTRVVEGKGPGQFDLPRYQGEPPTPTGEGDLTQKGSHREPIYQYRNAPKPGTEANVATDTPMGGGGTVLFTNDGQALGVERARQQLSQWNNVLNDPAELEEMGPRAAQRLQDAHGDLTEQLRRYDDFAASQPHFAQPDVVNAVRNTDSLGDAAEHLKAAHAPFWQAADKASGGEFTVLREREKWLQARLNSKNPIGNYDDLSAELKQNQKQQMDFFDKYKTTVSPQEWQTARSGYQDGMVLGNLNDMLQRKFGGISRELEQRGMATGNQRQRVFQPSKNFNQELEDFYNEGVNRDVLQRTIGQDHMDSLHDLGLMFSNSDRMEKTQGLMQNILTSIRHHYHGVRGMLAGGAGMGMLAAHQLGMIGTREAGIAGGALTMPILTGTASGINRYITNKLITDPAFLKTFSYALDKVPARTAGPLLAARIIAGMKTQDLKEKQQPQGAP